MQNLFWHHGGTSLLLYPAYMLDVLGVLILGLAAAILCIVGVKSLRRHWHAMYTALKRWTRPISNIESNIRIASEIGTTPRQLIFTIDMCIVLCAVLFNNLLVTGISTQVFVSPVFYLQVGVYLAFHACTFLKFRTYAGSVRHSTLYDALKLFLAVGLAHIFIFLTDEIYALVIGIHVVPFDILIYGLALTCLGLLLFRLGIKSLFSQFDDAKKIDSTQRAVIFGVDNKAVSLAESLLSDASCKFEIVAFMSNYKRKINTFILERPILSLNGSIGEAMRGIDSSVLILSVDSLTEKEKFKIVDDCTKNNIRIYIAPLITYNKNEGATARKLRDLRIEDLLYRPPIEINANELTTVVREKVVLVTGGAGSIGSELVIQIAALDATKIIVFDIAESPLYDLEMQLMTHFPFANFVPVIGDVTNKRDVEKVFEKYRPDLVYHAAAYKHVPMMEKNPAQAIKVNILGTKIVADLAHQYGAERFVMISTDKAVNPTNIMGVTKKIAELYIQAIAHKRRTRLGTTHFITTRFGNVLGSNGSVVPLFKRQINEGGPVTVTHPDITRYFMTIPEACQLVLIASCMGSAGDTFLFDMGTPIRIMDLAEKMIQIAGLKPYRDIEIKISGLRPGEKLYEELYTSSAKVMPTGNPKILRVLEAHHNSNGFYTKLEGLFNNLYGQEPDALIRKLKEMVPEYTNGVSTERIFVPAVYQKVQDG